MKRTLATQYAVETITNIIKSHVFMMNLAMREEEKDAFERFRAETMGMLICLKNINEDDRFYCLNIFDNKTEFGYYDQDNNWNIIK